MTTASNIPGVKTDGANSFNNMECAPHIAVPVCIVHRNDIIPTEQSMVRNWNLLIISVVS